MVSVQEVIEAMTKMSDEEVKTINDYSSKELSVRLYNMRRYYMERM